MMSDKFHITIILGTRPEIIRLSRIIIKLRQYFKVTIIHTGQNYSPELSNVFFSDLGIPAPDYYLGINAASLGVRQI